MKMKRLFLFPIFVAALAAVASPAAFAQGTPDGETPAQEDVCAMESGAAFGLCNAYCEAMDCDLANDGDPDTAPAASAVACAKVYNDFMQIRGIAPPCEAAPTVCGDGVLDDGEECDDGNVVNGDGCDDLCFIEGVARCGNNVCETADGETCENCAADCNGDLTGAPHVLFCCGFDANESSPYAPDGCGTGSLCNSDGNTCTTVPVG
jgi:cysteine-rich repeat protein